MPSKKKNQPKKTASLPAPPSQAGEDDSALSAFCNSVHLEEISFDSWQSCMSALDITVPLFVTAAEAATGADKKVKFSRQRVPAEILVTVPPQSADGLKLKVSGQGDAHHDKRGDLVIIVRIKSSV